MAFRGETKLCVEDNYTATKRYAGRGVTFGGRRVRRKSEGKKGGKKYNLE